MPRRSSTTSIRLPSRGIEYSNITSATSLAHGLRACFSVSISSAHANFCSLTVSPSSPIAIRPQISSVGIVNNSLSGNLQKKRFVAMCYSYRGCRWCPRGRSTKVGKILGIRAGGRGCAAEILQILFKLTHSLGLGRRRLKTTETTGTTFASPIVLSIRRDSTGVGFLSEALRRGVARGTQRRTPSACLQGVTHIAALRAFRHLRCPALARPRAGVARIDDNYDNGDNFCKSYSPISP